MKHVTQDPMTPIDEILEEEFEKLKWDERIAKVEKRRVGLKITVYAVLILLSISMVIGLTLMVIGDLILHEPNGALMAIGGPMAVIPMVILTAAGFIFLIFYATREILNDLD